jgi:hypothetical protein
LVFHHIAVIGAEAEVSGHYQSKAAVQMLNSTVLRPCFFSDYKWADFISFLGPLGRAAQ